MRTFKRGDKVTVALKGVVINNPSIDSNFVVLRADGMDYKVLQRNVTEHTISEPSKSETVAKVDGRVFLLDTTRVAGSPRWISARNSAYKWSELQTLGEIEIIHESEDV